MKLATTFTLFFVLGCSQTTHKLKRYPSSILETKSFDAQFTLFSGADMPQEQIIAKSLPNAPLRIDLSNVSDRIKCTDSMDGKIKESFLLPPNSTGAYSKVSCTLAHNGTEYPDKLNLEAKIYVLLDEYTIPDQDFVGKKTILQYQNSLTNKLAWDKGLIDVVSTNVEIKELTVDTRSSAPVLVMDGPKDGGLFFLDILSYSGEFETSGFLKKTKLGVAGKNGKDKKSLYQNYNELSLVCGTGIQDNAIKNVTNGQGDLFQGQMLSEAFYCHVNKKKDSDMEKKNSGVLKLKVKTITHTSLNKLLANFLTNEQLQLDQRIKAYHSTEFNQVASNFQEIKQAMNEIEKSLPKIKNRIDREKFSKFKDSMISTLFPSQIKGTIARSANLITFSPVKKTVYNEAGTLRSILYLSVSNSISYKVETPEFIEKIDRDLPFEEKVNLFLATNSEYKNTIKKTSLIVCEDRLDDFYTALGKIQTEANKTPQSMDAIFRELKATSSSSISSCKSSPKDKTAITYSRGKGPTDYFIQWIKLNDKELEASKVGLLYTSDYMGKPITAEVLRDKSQPHPVFKPGIKINFSKDQHDKLWQEAKGAYVIQYSDEEFFKAGE